MIGVAIVVAVLASALALVALLGVAFYFVPRRGPPDDGRFAGMKLLAAKEGLELELARRTTMHGSFRGRSARVRWESRPERTEVAVTTACRVLDVRAAADDNAWKAVGAGSIRRTGDHLFDEAVIVRGKDVPALLALLDQDTRGLLRESAAGSITVEAGEVRVRTAALELAPEAIVAMLSRLAGFAERLEALEKTSVPGRLAAMAGADGIPGVRRRATEILVEKFANTEFAAEAARRAIGDSDSGVRAQAAPLGESSVADEALAAAVRDESAPEKSRREALARAAAVLDRDDILRLYDVALASKIPALQRDGISGFARLRHGAGVERLARLPQETHDELTLCELAEALTEIAGPGAEAALVSLLDLPMPAVQALAAQGLGKIGSPVSITRLQPIAALVLGPPDVRESAANAIAAIRTRHPGAA